MLDEIMSKQGEGKQVVYLSPYPGPDGCGSPEDEINLLELWNVLWRRKIFISGFTLLMTLIAVYVTLYVLPVTYQSQAVLLPNGSSDSSKLGSLASLAGSLPIPISLPGGDSGSQLLLAFLQSRDLKLKLIEKYELLPRLYKEVWDPVNRVWVVENPAERPTAILAIQKEKLKEIYKVEQDDTTKLITITWVDEEAPFAAEMLRRVTAELDYYLANEYVSDAKRERLFVEKQLADATRELERWEQQVPTDEIPLATIKREQLAASTVYVELRKQVELAKFAEEKEVINFKTIDKPFVPEDRYKPKRALICALTLAMAGFISIIIVFIQNGVANQRRKEPR